MAVVVGGLALAIFIALRPGVSPTEDAAPTSSSAPSTTEQTQALPEPTAGPDAPDPVTPPPAPEPVTLVAPAPTAASRTGTEVATDTPAPRPSGSVPAVVSAQLCRNAPAGEAWQCDPASGPLDPGALFFYTRIAATSDTLVEHRWYRGDRLHQTVPLRIRANAGGFRTFSRNTVSPERAGDWKVELRAQDGTVLHEERFSVR